MKRPAHLAAVSFLLAATAVEGGALRGGVVINELLPDPNGAASFDTDRNGRAEQTDEYVELLNLATTTLDLGGLELWDPAHGRWFVFPAGATLAPGGVALVVWGVQPGGSLPPPSDGSLAFDAGNWTALLGDLGDAVLLYDPADDRFLQVVYGERDERDPSGWSGLPASATAAGPSEHWGSPREGLAMGRGPRPAREIASGMRPTPGWTEVEPSAAEAARVSRWPHASDPPARTLPNTR